MLKAFLSLVLTFLSLMSEAELVLHVHGSISSPTDLTDDGGHTVKQSGEMAPITHTIHTRVYE